MLCCYIRHCLCTSFDLYPQPQQLQCLDRRTLQCTYTYPTSLQNRADPGNRRSSKPHSKHRREAAVLRCTIVSRRLTMNIPSNNPAALHFSVLEDSNSKLPIVEAAAFVMLLLPSCFITSIHFNVLTDSAAAALSMLQAALCYFLHDNKRFFGQGSYISLQCLRTRT